MSAVDLFPLTAVRLEDGLFRRAQDLNIRYILQLDPDRLLAPFLREAGLEAAGQPYGNWESSGLAGHTAGHYLSAASAMFASTGDSRMYERAAYVVKELARAQEALGSGFVGGSPESAALWSEVARGDVDATTFSRGERWAPWYNVHKTLAGLIDCAVHAGISSALEVAQGLGEWCIEVTKALDDEKFELMLDTEFGGMNESLARLASLTHRSEFLALARRFSHRVLLESLAAGRDELTGLHANTQIPKVIGYQVLSEADGDPDAAAAARFFWQAVTGRRSVSIGGNSVREHFNDPSDYSSMVEDREGPETCNSHNMVRLSGELFRATGGAVYLGAIERILFNHVLSSQHPEHGGLVYFTSMRPQHYRVYSRPEECFWCCVGTGMEAHARHGQYVFARAGDELWVNLFIAATVVWDERGVTVRQQTGFPFEQSTRLIIERAGSGSMPIRIRMPDWLSGSASIRVNGSPVKAKIHDDHAIVDRQWRDGDCIDVELPMAPAFDLLPDGSAWASARYGPITLAGARGDEPLTGLLANGSRMGHAARGPLVPLASVPILPDTAPAAIRTTDLRRLAFAVMSDVGEISLQPFFATHDTRYIVYWPIGAHPAARRQELGAIDARVLGIDERTIDVVAFGEQQPEADHRFDGAGSERGNDGEFGWRRTSGRLAVELTDWARRGRWLRLTRIPSALARYDIVANGMIVARVGRGGAEPPAAVEEVDYPIPAENAELDLGEVRVEIIAHGGEPTDRIVRIRLLSE